MPDEFAPGFGDYCILIAQQTWVLVGNEIDGDEGGVTRYLVTSLGLGFYLWVLSFVIVGAAVVIDWLFDTENDAK